MTVLLQPPGPKPTNIIRSVREMRHGLLNKLQEAAAYGDIVAIPLAGRVIYFVNNPDYIKYVLVDNNQNYHKGRALKALRPIIGDGLLSSEDDFHKRQRRMIQPAFHRRRIATYAEVMTAHTQAHIADWRDGDQRDLHHELMMLTMGIVTQCLFDVDVRGEANGLGAALEGLFDNFSLMDLSPLGRLIGKLPLPRSQRRKEYSKILDDAIYGFIHERRSAGNIGLSQRDDLLSMLLESVDTEGDGEGMSDQQARDEVMTLFLAGHETTANALSWTLYLLSQHPESAAKLYAELDFVLGSRPPTMDDLPNLPYNRMIFSEAMRLYPPAWTIGRTAIAQDEIGGYVIPAGSTVLMSQYVMHRTEKYWDAPTEFRPERFDPVLMKDRPRYTYFPFGGGPRLCIGEPFAWMEGELLLATIAQRYHFTLAQGAIIEPEPLITLRLKHGLPMVIHSRVSGTFPLGAK